MWNSYEDLQWHVKYDRKVQIERLNEHLRKGNSIVSFYHLPGERDLDSILERTQNLLDEHAAEVAKTEAKKARLKNILLFWKK